MADQSKTKYYRTKVVGLEVVIGEPDPTKGEVAPQTVAFVPYWEQALGVEGKFKVAYAATDDATAIRKLKNDPNVEEISQEDYDKATTVTHDEKTKEQLTAFRAPY